MLLKYFYDQKLAHASYLVGCQKTKEVVVIDPGRDIDQYLEMSEREGLNLIAVAETHIHADYVSGARELADQFGARLYLSDEGPAEWKYEYASNYDSRLLKDRDSFMVGNIQFEVIHTPGHTPESISFLLTDQGGGADKPMGIFTGDFVFVGSMGRPDLLEEAAGIKGSAAAGAHQLFHSAERFKQLPDYLQVWPAHGAGSACGKGLGAIPSSTVGYEKLFNPSLQYTDEQAFVDYILSDQPEAPKYFAVMKRVNKEGPKIIGDAKLPELCDVSRITSIAQQATVIDISSAPEFAKAHVPGTINIPFSLLATWAGWIVDYSRPVFLLAETAQLTEALRVLHKIGIDQVQGLFETAAVRAADLNTEGYVTESPDALAQRIESGKVTLLDVSSDSEWNTNHIPQARHFYLGHLPDRLSEIAAGKPMVVQCQSAARSAIAASILQAAGINVINMAGGFQAWQAAGLPTTETAHENYACGTAGVSKCSQEKYDD